MADDLRRGLPIPRMIDIGDYLDYVSNRVIPDLDVQDALERLWSASSTMGTDLTEDASDRRRGAGLR